jgi:chitodextrinase
MWIGGNNPYGEHFQGRIDDVRVYDRALSVSELTSDMNTPVGASAGADSTPPSAPGTLTANATSSTQISLTWGAATDDVGVTGYRVERCAGAGCASFAQIATPTGTSFGDTGLTASTSYSYRVRAVDAAGIWAFSNIGSATTQATTVIPGLVAAYSFDEGAGTTVLDRAGTNTGTIQGTVAWTTQGKNGGALTFNGTDNRVSIPASPSLNATNGLTLEAWVYPTATQSGWRAVVQKETDAWFLHASHDGGALRPAAGGTYGGNGDLVGSTSAIPLNTWTHLAQTYDGSTLQLYVNGVVVASKARTGALQTTTSPMWIGGNNPYGEYFTGRIDDVRVYDRALSVSEITSDMNTSVGAP